MCIRLVCRTAAMLACALLFAAAGCSTSEPTPQQRDRAPRRSLVVDHPRLARAEQRAGLDGELSWYDYRNDVQPRVFAGYVSPMREFTETITRDRLSTHNGNVRDHYHQRTTRGRIREAVR